jgi:hypothetical protein
MGSEWVPISMLPVPYPYFVIGENSNSYPNPLKAGKIRQIMFSSGGYPRIWILLPYLQDCEIWMNKIELREVSVIRQIDTSIV